MTVPRRKIYCRPDNGEIARSDHSSPMVERSDVVMTRAKTIRTFDLGATPSTPPITYEQGEL